MNRTIVAQDSEVVIGVDVHTDSHVVAVKAGKDIVDRISMKGRREEWGRYLKRFPGCVLHVVYESGPNGYNLHDLLMELDGEDGREVHAHVAPPSMLPQAPGRSRVKTDRRDAVKLIQAFESGCFRQVVVPDARRRACRQLVRERERIKKDVKRIKNRIHGLVKFHGLEYPQSQRWDAAWREGLTSQARRKDASGHVLFVLRTEFRLLDANLGLQAATEKQLARMFRTGAEKELYRKLTRQTGIGPVTAAVIATEVADFHAFDNSDAFASYTGLVSGARGTGKVMHLGPITKVGNRRLRWAFVESAWTWVRCDQAAKTRFELLKARRGARRAIVAMARRLAVLVYHQVVNDAPVATLSFRD